MDGTAPPITEGLFSVTPVLPEAKDAVVLEFQVLGTPKPKARPRFRRTPNFVQTYTPETTVNWENTIAWHAKEFMARLAVEQPEVLSLAPFTGRIAADLRFNTIKPKSAPKSVHYPVKAQPGDIDNLAKSVLDGLQIAQLIADDKTVTDLRAVKRFVEDDQPEGVYVRLKVWFD